MKTIKRVIQFLTGVHRIHHVKMSYGWKLPFVNIGYFDNYGWVNFSNDESKRYHNCTTTGVY